MTSKSKKRLIFLCVTLVVLGGAGVGAVMLRNAQRHRSLQQALSDGLAAYKAKQYEQALEKLAYYVGREPDQGPAVLALARTRWKIPTDNGEYLSSAARYAQHASKVMPTDPEPLEVLLSIYQEMGYQTERIETAERLLKLNPKHLGALRARAEAHILKNSKEQAEQSALAWTGVAPDSTDAHAAVIEAKRLAGRPNSEIEAYLAKVVAEHQGDFRFAVFEAAMQSDVLGNKPAAVAATKRALAMPPTDARSVSILLLLLDNHGYEREDKTLQGSADALLATPIADPAIDAEVAAIGAKRDYKLLQRPQLDRWMSRVVAAGQRAPDSALGTILYLSRTDAGVSAPRSVEGELARRDTPTAEAWQHLLEAQRLLGESDAPAARRQLLKVAALDPGNDLTLFLFAQADAQLNEWRRSAASLERLVSADPSWAIARRSLVGLLLRANQVFEALSQASEAYRARQRLGEAYMLADASVRAAEVSSDPAFARDAEAFVTQLGKERQDDALIQTYRARLHARASRRDEAIAMTRRVLASSASLPAESLVYLADSIRPIDAPLARSVLEMARKQYPADPDVALAAAEGLADTDPTGAEAILAALIDSQTGAAKDAAQRRLAAYLDRRGDPRAIEQLRKIAADHPTETAAQTLLLNSESAWSDEPTVAAAIKRYRDISGDDSTLWRVFEARRLLVFKPSSDYASRAVQLLVPVVNAESDNSLALALIADAHRALGDPGKSVEHIIRAVDANPLDPTFYPALISALDRAGRRVESDRRLDAMLRLSALSQEQRRQRARLLAEHGRWQQAAADYAAIVEGGGSQDDRLAWAMCLASSGDPGRAATVFAELTSAKNPSAQVLIAAADFAASSGDVDAGEKLLDRLPESLPAADRFTARATFLERHRRLEAAQRMYEQAAAGGDPDRVSDLVMFHLRSGHVEQALPLLSDALKKDPSNKRLKALANVAKARQGGSLSPGALGETLASLMTSEDPKAMEQWLSAVSLLESTPPNRERYMSELVALTRSYPRFYPGWHSLVVGSLETGDVDGVVQNARGLRAALPDNVRAARLAAEAFAAVGRLDEAGDAAEAWKRLSLTDAFEPDMQLARVRLRQGRAKDALDLVEPWKDRCIQDADRAPSVLETYAGALVKAGRSSEAHDLLLPRAGKSPEWLGVYLHVAALHDTDQAAQRSWAADAAAGAGKDAATQLVLGTFWHDLAAKSAAADDFNRAAQILSAISTTDQRIMRDALLLLASCYQSLNDVPKAQEAYRTILRTDSGDPIALNNLAFLLHSYGGDSSEAVLLATRAVTESERRGLPPAFVAGTLDTLGLVQIKQAKGTDALQTYERATRLNANDAALWVGLAEAQVLSGLFSDAKSSVSRVESMLRSVPPVDGGLQTRIAKLKERVGATSIRTNE
ncbi:MAG: hypothetical protein AB7G11_06655 [Phycisphaerales bacterium]